MSCYEDLLLQLENKLKDNNIKKKDVKDYIYLYGLNQEDLKKLLSTSFDNEIILSKLIKVLSIDNKYQDKEVQLLEKVSLDTDIKYDREKIVSLTSIINQISLFGDNVDLLETILDMGLRSKTKEASIEISKVVKDIMEYLSEDESIEIDRGLIIRLVEIIGFMTRTNDVYKVKASSDIVNNYPKDKIGSMCGLIAIMNKSSNKFQAEMIVDIAKNKGIRNHGLELDVAEVASKANISSLEEVSEILSYSDIVTEDDLKDDINDVKKRVEKVKVLR